MLPQVYGLTFHVATLREMLVQSINPALDHLQGLQWADAAIILARSLLENENGTFTTYHFAVRER